MARSQADNGAVLSEIQRCIRKGVPVSGGKLLISLPTEMVRDGQCRHVRALKNEIPAEIAAVLKDQYRRLMS